MNLAAEMAKLPEPPNDSKPPLWDAWRHDLWARAQKDDPHNFTKWPAVYHTMLVDHWLTQMQVEAQYVTEWMERNYGAPRQQIEAAIEAFRGVPYSPPPVQPPTDSNSLNLTHQAYHIARWQEATGLRIADMGSIYEFGGGYGAMALVCNRLGFKGKYYIYDLPEFSLLQRWYLEECGVENVEWVDKSEKKDVDLLVACYSLSETNLSERHEFLNSILANNYLFLYSNVFEQFDNIAYFQNMKEVNPAFDTRWQWRHERIEHLPPESWYSWGW